MNAEERVARRARLLLDKGKNITEWGEQVAWMRAAYRICSLLWPPDEIYVARLGELANRATEALHYSDFESIFSESLSLMEHAVHDIEYGLTASFLNHARAEVFDDLLDQAEFYQGKSNRAGSGVLASAVFEDCLRRIARSRDIQENGVKMDELITALHKDGTFSSVKATRCRSAAAVRNKALHARWDEFGLDDVRSTIALARDLILQHLDRGV